MDGSIGFARRRLLAALVAVLLFAAVSPVSAATVSPQDEHGGDFRQRDATLTRDVPATYTATPTVQSEIVSPAGVVGLFSDNFESEGVWNVLGVPGWGLNAYRVCNGGKAMYCAQTGRPAPGPYFPNMQTWMLVGPFNLSSYSSAALVFNVWMQGATDPNRVSDFFFAGASTDSVNFTGQAWEGSTGWKAVSVDVSPYCGQTSVYIGFSFVSDGAGELEGVYVDDVSLTVALPNVAPVAVADTYSVTQGKTKDVWSGGVLSNDYDPDNGPTALKAYLVSNPSHGSLGRFQQDGPFSYSPDPSYLGTDSFTYRVYDGKAYSGVATVTLNVVADLPPVGVDDAYTVTRGYSIWRPSPGLLENDHDPIGDRLTLVNASTPSNGTLYAYSNGSFTYIPFSQFVGVDSFTYQVSDGNLVSPPVTVTITVIDSPPVTVYRFYNARTGTHFYTADEAERAKVMATLSGTYVFEGPAYTLVPAHNDVPLYRFYQPRYGTHFYTADPAERDRVIANPWHLYVYEGVAYNVCGEASRAPVKRPVHRFYQSRTGTHLYTADGDEFTRLISDPAMRALYSYDGVGFYVGQ